MKESEEFKKEMDKVYDDVIEWLGQWEGMTDIEEKARIEVFSTIWHLQVELKENMS